MMVSIVGMSPGRSTTEDPDIVVDHVKKWEREAQGSCKSFISEIPAERKKNHQQRSTSIHLAAESRLSSILQKSYGLNKNNKKWESARFYYTNRPKLSPHVCHCYPQAQCSMYNMMETPK